MSDKPTSVKKAAKKTATKAAKAPVTDTSATTTAPLSAAAKRGSVLTPLTIKKILAFIGGDPDTVIEVSKKSLVDAKTRNARAAAAKDLASLNDLDDL